MKDFYLTNKVAFVVGGRRGIGKGCALGFAEAGADVAVGDLMIETGELEATVKEIRKLGRRSIAIQLDISKKADVERAVQKVVDELGSIDILVNLAVKETVSTMIELSEENWDLMFDITLKGYFLTCQAAAKRMIEQKRGGSIINFSSLSYKRPRLGIGAYPTAKAGVVMLTAQFALELAPYNIRCNCIAPGGVRTQLNIDMWDDNEWQKLIDQNPMGRAATPEEMANVAIFLASNAASYVTGHTILVDGGKSWSGAKNPAKIYSGTFTGLNQC